MEGRKWEELPTDCLVHIFERVGTESLLLDVPFVCKPWYKATLNPLCWQQLTIPETSVWYCDSFAERLMLEYNVEGDFPITKFSDFVINRSNGLATLISLPNLCTEELLLFVADKCPNLRKLVLSTGLSGDLMLKLPDLICKWENLLALLLGSSYNMRDILTQIRIHCKSFSALAVNSWIRKDEIMAIVTLLPKIKYLYLKKVDIVKEDLVMILKECRELVKLTVKGCFYFEVDAEILKLASHINVFKCEVDPYYFEEDHVSYHDDGFHDGCCSD